MARKWQIDTPAQIGGLLEALGGLTVTGTATLGSQASATTHAVRADRLVSTGTGLTGGGNLTANRTLAFDTTWGDARYALSGHNHDTAYAPLSHVGSRGTAHADATQTEAGFQSAADKAKLDNIQVNAINKTTADGYYPPLARTITAGTGLSGGGSLADNRTLSFDTTWGDARYLNKTGDTMTGSLTLAGTAPEIKINSGNGRFGYNTDTAWVFIGNNTASSWLRFADTGEVQFSTLNLTVGSGAQKIWHSGNDGAGSGLDADTVDGVQLSGLVQTSRSISTGTGLTGGGDLSANRTLSVNFAGTGSASTVARSDHNHTIAGASITDVAITTPSANQLLAYDTTAAKWLNKSAADIGLVSTSSYTASDILDKLLTVDGITSGLDADLLDGQQGYFYQNASNLNAGTLSDSRLSSNIPKLNAANTFTNNLQINGLLKVGKSTWQVTFAAGETRKTITHSSGSGAYMVALGADSVARHVAYENKTASAVDIVLDSPYTEQIKVDVILMWY